MPNESIYFGTIKYTLIMDLSNWVENITPTPKMGINPNQFYKQRKQIGHGKEPVEQQLGLLPKQVNNFFFNFAKKQRAERAYYTLWCKQSFTYVP